MQYGSKDVERLWAKVDKTPGHGPWGNCWVWTGALRNGYGYLEVSGKKLSTHRLSWHLSNPGADRPRVVRHDCDFRVCCNPSHLKAGTQADNIRDRDARGRTAIGERNGSRTRPERLKRGVESSKAKLNDETVRRMRIEHFENDKTITSLAYRVGVSVPTAFAAIHGLSWKHVK